MNLDKVLADLRAESKKLNEIIQTLERLTASDGIHLEPANRRGRKKMDPASRRQVSERMKQYWENRRKSPPTAPA
jgi:hypothetical protein